MSGTRPAQHNLTLESIKYDKDSGKFTLLDQRQLPHKTVFDTILTVQDVWTAIKEMRVRGAPAIAVSAALGVAVAAEHKLKNGDEVVSTVDGAKQFLLDSLDFVATSRPTAVNLFNAVEHLKAKVNEIVGEGASSGADVVHAFTRVAEEYYEEDVAFNTGIMQAGAKHILSEDKGANEEKVNILTICNTGALATSRYGTALGVVRQLHYDGKLEQLYACETRPWNQGARLTIYECAQEKIPATLICDSAAASLMRSRKIHAVIVGADRICQNGDTANKIGTYNLAVTAKHHGVKFYVAAPSSTLDPKTAAGSDVHIEEREPTEITHNMATNERCVAEADNISIWNPVFDVTPGELITGGVITEKGVFTPTTTYPHYDIAAVKTK